MLSKSRSCIRKIIPHETDSNKVLVITQIIYEKDKENVQHIIDNLNKDIIPPKDATGKILQRNFNDKVINGYKEVMSKTPEELKTNPVVIEIIHEDENIKALAESEQKKLESNLK